MSSATDTLEIQREHAAMGVDFEMYPIPGETYPEGFRFTAREMVGRRFRNSRGVETICSCVEHDRVNGPQPHFIADFTKPYPKNVGLVGTDWGVNSIQWRNMEANLSDMQLTLDNLPQVDTVYCVGSGPSLMRNWRDLLKVDKRNSAIIGCNELLQYLPAGLVDYYCVLDAASPTGWHAGLDVSGTTAIFAPIVPPHFKHAGWRKALWYRIGLDGKLSSYVSNRKGHLTPLIPYFGVGPTQLQIAWLMRPKRVVLVGHTYAYDRVDGTIYEHINEPLTEDRWEGILRSIDEFATVDLFGKPIITDYHILITMFMTLTSAQYLMDAGVEVINATEGGVLRSNPDIPAYRDRPLFPACRRLAEVVEEAA